MTQFPSEKEITTLQSVRDQTVITIYVPYISANTADNPERIVLKNLLRIAKTRLLAEGHKSDEVDQLFTPAKELLSSREFWPAYRADMALFMAPGFFRYYHLPRGAVRESLTIGRRFRILPLTNAISSNRSYFVLALSHNQLRLYEGDRFELRPLSMQQFTGSMEEVLRIDEHPKSRELHPVASASFVRDTGSYHEQYDVTETDKAMLRAFFLRADAYLHAYLTKRSLPLVLAGVTYLQPIYREINTYAGLLPRGITGNVERATDDTIRQRAWRIVKREEATTFRKILHQKEAL